MVKFRHSYTTKDAALLPIFILLMSLVYSFLFSLIATKVAISSGYTTEAKLAEFMSLPWVNIINMVAGQIFILGTFIVYSIVNGKNMANATTIKGKIKLWQILVVMAMAAVCIFGFNYLISLTNIGINKLTKIPEALVEVPAGFAGYLIVVLVFAIVPAIVEELVYRGVVFNGLKKNFSTWPAVILSSVIFTLMHFNVYQVVYQLILGVVLAIIAHYTGTILYSMLFHLLNNFIAVTLSIYAPAIFVIDPTKGWVIALILIGALIAAAAIFGLVFLLIKVCKKDPSNAEVIEEKSEQEQLLENSEGLSEYDIRQLNPQKLKDKTWVWLCLTIYAVVWIIINFIA